YEGVGPCQGCWGARALSGSALSVSCGLPSVAGGPIVVLAVARVVSGQARLPRHVFALVVRMVGSVATAGEGSISSATVMVCVGHAVRRARDLVVSESHAAVVCARHRISPSRKP